MFVLSWVYEFISCGDWIGWVEGIDGKYYLILFIENGCILDFLGKLLKMGVVEIVKVY